MPHRFNSGLGHQEVTMKIKAFITVALALGFVFICAWTGSQAFSLWKSLLIIFGSAMVVSVWVHLAFPEKKVKI